MNSIVEFGTNLSKVGNYLLLDRTGRTITRTAMDGGANLTNGKIEFSGMTIHAIMIGSTLAIYSPNKKLRTAGIIGWGLIGLAYLAGRR